MLAIRVYNHYTFLYSLEYNLNSFSLDGSVLPHAAVMQHK